MDYGHSTGRREPPHCRPALKILVAGGFGVGKTTCRRGQRDQPLRTEEVLTEPAAGRRPGRVEGKTTTTVAMDFGRITISDGPVLYLFGTPGQDRFWFLWDELAPGRSARWCWPTPAGSPTASRRSTTSSAAASRSSSRSTASTAPVYPVDDVREALDLAPTCRRACDARRRQSGREVLVTLIEHALRRATPGDAERAAPPRRRTLGARRPGARLPPREGEGARPRAARTLGAGRVSRRPPASRGGVPPPCASCGNRLAPVSVQLRLPLRGRLPLAAQRVQVGPDPGRETGGVRRAQAVVSATFGRTTGTPSMSD